MTVRRAVPGEGTIVARLILASLPSTFVPFTIWRSAKAGAWVETQLAAPLAARGEIDSSDENGGLTPFSLPHGVDGPELPVRRKRQSVPIFGAPHFCHGLLDESLSAFYLLLGKRGDAAGVVEFRTFGGGAFLNHIAVAPSFRGRGCGRLLLRSAAKDFLAQHPARRVLLDVDPSNAVAYEWYSRLGFVPFGETYWQLGEIQRQPARAGAVLGLAHAEAMHRRFGFSQLRIETHRDIRDAGRLGREYFRLDQTAWDDPGVHAALRLLDAKRRILLVTSTAQAGLRIVRRTARLAVEAALLFPQQCLRQIQRRDRRERR
jgi:GNAT superfamily N-acetyltransferase